MDLQHLRYYNEIVKCKSFTKAATQLGITQPMLTRVIKNLEEELDVKLIERTSKYFNLTDAGEVFYQQSLDFLLRFNDIYRSIDDVKSSNSGEVRFSTPGVILDMYFPILLKQFHSTYPNINISIVEEGSKLTAQSVLSDTADLGMVMLPVANQNQFHTTIVISSVCQVVLSKKHPLAKRQWIQMRELQDDRFITFSDTATLHDAFISICEKEGFAPRIAYKSLMPSFIFEMVSHNLCSAILPLPIIERYITGDLVTVPLRPSFEWKIAVISKKERYQSYASRKLLSFMCEYFQVEEDA